MQFSAFVLDEVDTSYDGRSGHVAQRSLILSDRSVPPALQYFEYPLKGDEAVHSGKLNGKTFDVVVLEIVNVFGGRPRIARGKLLINGEALPAGKAK